MTHPTHTLTYVDGPLGGQTVETATNVAIINALGYKREDGTWGHPSELLTEDDTGAGAKPLSPSTWPKHITERTREVEYLVDRDRGTASFREPAEIRVDEDADETPPEFRPADPRSRDASHLAWIAVSKAIDDGSGGIEACQHPVACKTAAVHVGLLASEAIRADGLRIIEPTHVTPDAIDALARLLHDGFDSAMGDPNDPDDWDAPQGEIVREQWREVATEVLTVLDVRDEVVVVHPSEEVAASGADFAGLADVLRNVCGADLMLAIPPDGSVTLETVDRDEMRRAGWLKMVDGQPMLSEADTQAYLDGVIQHWRDARKRRQAEGDLTAVGECAAYVDAFQSARVTLLGAPLPPEPVEGPVVEDDGHGNRTLAPVDDGTEQPGGEPSGLADTVDAAQAPPLAVRGPDAPRGTDGVPVPTETIAERDMREVRERRERLATTANPETWETVWECEEPPDGVDFQVLQDVWNADGSVRHIIAINRLDQNPPVRVAKSLDGTTTTSPAE